MSLGQQLSGALNHEADCLQRLLDILKQEHDALLAADIDAIERVTASKNQALAVQLEAESTRHRLLSQSSIDITDEGLLLLIAKCDNREQLTDSVSHLNSLTQLCRASNRANGRLIMQKQEQARGALNVIRQTSSAAPTYSGQGKTTATQANRSLGKA